MMIKKVYEQLIRPIRKIRTTQRSACGVDSKKRQTDDGSRLGTESCLTLPRSKMVSAASRIKGTSTLST